MEGSKATEIRANSMTKKPLAVFAQVLAALYGVYGLFPIVAATQLAEDPFWFQVVLVLGGLSTIACGIAGFWFAARWYHRLANPPEGQAGEPTVKKLDE
jgi:hypothetical protein